MNRFPFLGLFGLLLIAAAGCNNRQLEPTPTTAPIATVPVLATVPAALPTPTPSSIPGQYINSKPNLVAPSIEIVSASEDPVSAQNPAVVEFEIATMSPVTITFDVWRLEEEARRQAVDHWPLIDGREIGAREGQIPPGIHELLEIWPARGHYLSDGAAGDFVLLQVGEPGRGIIRGQFRPSGLDDFAEAMLVFSLEDWSLVGVIDPVGRITLQQKPGDVFQTQHLVSEDEVLSTEVGTLLIFDENGSLNLEERPLPDGEYSLNVILRSQEGSGEEQIVGFTVDNSHLIEGQKTFVDPSLGLQFRLPDKWLPVKVQDQTLESGDPESSVKLTVVTRPGMLGFSARDLQNQTLDAFGEVQVLYEETILVDRTNASWTAYSYESEDGRHTGVFLAVVNDGVGHVVDVEGLSDDQNTVMDVVEMVMDSLVFRSLSGEDNPGNWIDVEADGFVVSAGSTFLASRLENGWHRFIAKDGDSFIALRALSPGDSDIEEAHHAWLASVGEGVSGFATSQLYRLRIVDATWLRSDFAYESAEGGRNQGFVMSAASDDRQLIAWAETPEGKFAQTESEVFLLMLADLSGQG